MRLKLVHSKLKQRTQNLEFVNLKCVTYAQPIPRPLSGMGRHHSVFRREQKTLETHICSLNSQKGLIFPILFWFDRAQLERRVCALTKSPQILAHLILTSVLYHLIIVMMTNRISLVNEKQAS